MAILAALALWPGPPLWLVIPSPALRARKHVYVVLTDRAHSPSQSSGPATASPRRHVRPRCQLHPQWITGLLVALPSGTASAARPASPGVGSLALMLLAAILVYPRRGRAARGDGARSVTETDARRNCGMTTVRMAVPRVTRSIESRERSMAASAEALDARATAQWSGSTPRNDPPMPPPPTPSRPPDGACGMTR